MKKNKAYALITVIMSAVLVLISSAGLVYIANGSTSNLNSNINKQKLFWAAEAGANHTLQYLLCKSGTLEEFEEKAFTTINGIPTDIKVKEGKSGAGFWDVISTTEKNGQKCTVTFRDITFEDDDPLLPTGPEGPFDIEGDAVVHPNNNNRLIIKGDGFAYSYGKKSNFPYNIPFENVTYLSFEVQSAQTGKLPDPLKYTLNGREVDLHQRDLIELKGKFDVTLKYYKNSMAIVSIKSLETGMVISNGQEEDIPATHMYANNSERNSNSTQRKLTSKINWDVEWN